MDLLDYCSVVWNSCSQTLSNNIERVQNYVMRLTLNKPPLTRSETLRQFLSWSTLKERRDKSTLICVHCCTSGVSAVSSLSFVKVPSKLKPCELSREKRQIWKEGFISNSPTIEIHLNFKVQCSSTLYQQTKQDRLLPRGFN